MLPTQRRLLLQYMYSFYADDVEVAEVDAAEDAPANDIEAEDAPAIEVLPADVDNGIEVLPADADNQIADENEVVAEEAANEAEVDEAPGKTVKSFLLLFKFYCKNLNLK